MGNAYLPRRVGWLRVASSFTLPLLVLGILSGCNWNPNKVITSANSWAFYAERRKENCAISTPVCDCRYSVLSRWEKLLKEADKAVSRGGKYPLQLDALRSVEKEYLACK